MAETGQVLHQNRARVAGAWFALVAMIVLGGGNAHAAGTRPIGDAIVLGSQRCLQREALSRRLGTWLGTDVVEDRIAITIDEDPRAVRFVLRRDGSVVGERTIAVGDDTCDDVTAAVALAIASAIEVAARADEPPIDEGADPAADASPPARDAAGELAAAAPAPPPAAPAPAPPAPSGPAPAPSPPGPPRVDTADEATSPGDSSRRGTLALTVQGAALVGVFPRPAFAIAPAASLAIGESAELRLSAIGAVPVIVDLEPSGTAEVTLYAGRLDGCGGDHLLDGHAWIRGCGGLAVGGVPADGVDVEDPSSSVGAWVAFAARAELQWMPSSIPVGVAISVDGFVPVVRPRLEVQDGGGEATATRDLPLLGAAVAVGPCVLF